MKRTNKPSKMQEDNSRLNALTDQLNTDLRKAEEYGDELRNTSK